ncbi:MAG: SDR family oxidoreductase [Pseudomonadota bacterium]
MAEIEDLEQIAVVGMAGRYPKAPDINAFWRVFRDGVDCLERFSDDELDEIGIPAAYYNRENFIRRGTRLPDASRFDAAFFGFTPREAMMMDPQSRVFLETCYQALDHAGYDPSRYERAIGVFAGSNPNDYAALLGTADPSDSLAAFDQLIGSDKDFLATRVSHRLNLKGPALTLQTACSTSLVAVHVAVQSLLNYECSMALAGGVTANFRQGGGYFYQNGMILSPNGTCRAFDAAADGTTLGQGCGVAVLKRLSDAIEDGDTIFAVVKASAINNDGAAKISYTAPSEDGQAEVIALAHELAGVSADTISYVETHGTGTKLGDPIEIAALTRAFAAGTTRKGYCAVGSAKSNLGHTDAAAGVTGFLKTVMALHHRQIPKSLHFETPNPEIDFANSPFFVADRLIEWAPAEHPRRAGVSAFGIGGTNAHVVLEEAPAEPERASATGKQFFLLSAKTAGAAEQKLEDLAGALESSPAIGIGDVAYTLRNGRQLFSHRRAVVIDPADDAVRGLRGGAGHVVARGVAGDKPPSLIWLYTGQGAQYPGMAAGLYRDEPVFRAAVDACADLFAQHLDQDIRQLIFEEDTDDRLHQTAFTQPALFTVEYAVSQLLHSWGLAPDRVVGHSIGEYAAAVEAGVMYLADAAKAVAARGRLMQAMAPGSMASVPLSASMLRSLLIDGVELAAENAPDLSVVSGPDVAIEAFITTLASREIKAQRLQTSHAFHSAMMEEAREQFAEVMIGIALASPKLPMMSNVTGDLLTDAEAVDPAFWASQIRKPVQFAACIRNLGLSGDLAFLEVGPGRALSTMVLKAEMQDKAAVSAVSMIRHPKLERDDRTVAYEAIAKLWTTGVELEWARLGQATEGRRVPLPAYPFDRQDFWLPQQRHQLQLAHFGQAKGDVKAPLARKDIGQWLYALSYQRAATPPPLETGARAALVLAPATPGADIWLTELASTVGRLITVRPGDRYHRDGDHFEVDPERDEDLEQVFDALAADDTVLDLMIHAWLADDPEPVEDIGQLDRSLGLGVYTVHGLARAASRTATETGMRIEIVTLDAMNVMGTEAVRPEAAALLGPAKVIPLEYPGVQVRLTDLAVGLSDGRERAALNRELSARIVDPMIALRGGQRWHPAVACLEDAGAGTEIPLQQGGVYLIVGGLGGVGLSIGRHLAETYEARLALTSRGGRPVSSDDMSDEQRQRLSILEEIERLSPESRVYAADAADEEAMTEVVRRTEAEIGPINGVIVAAGIADQGGSIHRRTREVMRQSIASKAHGSLILERLFQDREIDFILLSSSVASTLYHNRFAQVGYVTGNGVAEAFALRGRHRGLPVTTIAWDDWLTIGMSVRAAEDFGKTYGADITLMDELNSFSPDEGVALLGRALAADEPVMVVSPTDLPTRIRDDVHVVSPFLEQAVGGEGDGAALAGEGSLEDHIVAIWKDILGFETIQPSDDFFELGGDSLQAARMADQLSRALGVGVSLNLLFDHSRLADMVDAVGQLVDGGGAADAEMTKPDVGRLSVSPAQIRLARRGSPNPHYFNVSALLRPTEPAEPEHLERAVRLLVESNSALRTHLVEENGELVAQQVLPIEEAWHGIERRAIPGTGEEAKQKVAAICREVQEGLHVYDGPLLRVVLMTDQAGEQRLFLAVHHQVSDRMSLFLMLDNLDQLYAQFAAGKSEVEPPLASVSYGRWIGALEAYAASEDGQKQSDAWLALDWQAVRPLPLDRPSEPMANINANASGVKVTLEGEKALRILRHDDGRSDELVMLAIGRALAAWSGSERALIESLSHGRRLSGLDVSRSIGCFLTYQPMLLDGRDNLSTADGVAALRGQMEQAWSFDALRFYASDQALRDRIEALPRAEVLYNFVGRPIESKAAAALQVVVDEDRGRDTPEDGVRDHKIAIMAEIIEDRMITLTLVYCTAIHDEGTIRKLGERVIESLEAMADAQ